MEEAWKKTLKLLKKELPPYLHRSLLQSSRPIDTQRIKKEKTFVLEIEDSSLMPQLGSFYWESILRQLQNCLQSDLQLEIRAPVASGSEQASSSRVFNRIFSSATTENDLSWIDPNHRFETFVRGKSNLAAALACEYVAAIPGKTIPLILCGDVGLGKTHLAHAVAYEVGRRNKGVKIASIGFADLYNSSQQMKEGHSNPLLLEKLLEKCLQLDMLIIEDILLQELTADSAHAENLRANFMSLLDHCFNNRKQLILTSREPVPDKNLTLPHLRRLNAGLQAQIQSPSRELQVAFLRKYLKEIDNSTDPKRLHRLLPYCSSGNLHKLERFAEQLADRRRQQGENGGAKSLQPQKRAEPPDWERMIAELVETDRERLQFELNDIVQAVASSYQVDSASLFSSSRKAEFALPRHVAMYLATQHTNLKKSAIGRFFRRCDHTTVLHAERKITRKLAEDMLFRQLISKIIKRLSG